MSHYFAVVLVPADGPVDDHVQEAMAPFSEEIHPRKGWWDWWVIGGRWTGVWAGYEPAEDPANWETCFICGGTGIRDDDLGREQRAIDRDYTCNGCAHDPTPPGKAVKHPPQWIRHPGDIVAVSWLLDRLGELSSPYTVVAPEGPIHSETWDKNFIKHEDFDAAWMKVLEAHRDMRAVVVDYHS